MLIPSTLVSFPPNERRIFIQLRSFRATPSALKKKKEPHLHENRHEKYNPQDLRNDPPKQPQLAVDKAFDFSELESGILRSVEQLSHKLSELRAGGRLSPTTIEVLLVKLDKDSSTHVKIKDIAQVVTKGQYIHVILSDEQVCCFPVLH